MDAQLQFGLPRKFELPMPPPLNSLYRFYKGKLYMVTEARRYKWMVSAELKRIKPPKFDDSAKISMRLVAHPSNGTESRRDADGYLKIVLDSFQDGNLFTDDNQIKHIEVVIMPPDNSLAEGFIEIEFAEILN